MLILQLVPDCGTFLRQLNFWRVFLTAFNFIRRTCVFLVYTEGIKSVRCFEATGICSIVQMEKKEETKLFYQSLRLKGTNKKSLPFIVIHFFLRYHSYTGLFTSFSLFHLLCFFLVFLFSMPLPAHCFLFFTSLWLWYSWQMHWAPVNRKSSVSTA